MRPAVRFCLVTSGGISTVLYGVSIGALQSSLAAMCTAVVLSVLLDYVVFLLTLPRDLPPGPFPLPLIGNVYVAYGLTNHEFCDKLFKRYGPIATIYHSHSVGAIICLTRDSINEVFNSSDNLPVMGNRRKFYKEMRLLTQEGFIWSVWPAGNQVRRFIHHSLTSYGVRNESRMLDTLAQTMSGIESKLGKPVGASDLSFEFIVPVYSGYVFGRPADPRLFDLLPFATAFLKLSVLEWMMVPYARLANYIFPIKYLADEPKREKKLFDGFYQLITEELKSREDNPVTRVEDATNMLEYYSALKATGQNSPLDEFVMLASQMYITQAATGSQAFRLVLLYFCWYPEEQERINEDISNHVAAGFPTLQHRKFLTRFDAFYQESMRHFSIATLMINHESSRDIKYKNYTIPAFCEVAYSPRTNNLDPEVFDQPNEFRVDRWLKDGVLQNLPSIPFGVGARKCLGRDVMGIEIYLLMTAIIQRYRVRLAYPDKPIAWPVNLLDRIVPDFEVTFTPRY